MHILLLFSGFLPKGLQKIDCQLLICLFAAYLKGINYFILKPELSLFFNHAGLRITTLNMEGTKSWADVPPIKNSLQALCKVIRNHSLGARVFICNHLPRINGSPMQQDVSKSNFTLQQAVRSIGRSMGSVFELSIFEHFTSKKGKIPKEARKLFCDSHNLSPLGCITFRECIMREVGIKNYWISERNGRDAKRWRN